MGEESSEIEGAHGLRVDEVVDKAVEVIARLFDAEGLANNPALTGEDLRAHLSGLNGEVHRAIPALPRDMWVTMSSAVTSPQHPGWGRVTVRVERRILLGEGAYERGTSPRDMR